MTDTHNRDAAGQGPRIDVLIPAFNAAQTVQASVACMLEQTIADLRVIVVDDGSTDATGAILDEMAAADPRLLVHHQRNGGIVDALNAALALSTAPFIARHDADDIAYPDRLERQLAYLDGNPDCVAVGANAWHIDGHGRRLGSRTDFSGDVTPDAAAVPAREPYLMHPFLLMRRAALVDAGGYRYCFHAEDADLYWRLLEAGRLHNLDDVLGEYRVHEGSVSSTSARNGRIAAKYSQLAALAHLRHRRGKAEDFFDRADLPVLNALGDLDAVIEHRSDRLTPGERAHLRRATAAKLMELASYRPYVLDVADCRQLRRDLADLSGLPPRQVRAIRGHQAEVLRRYIDAGHWPQVRALGLSLPVYLRLPRRYLGKLRKAIAARRAERGSAAAA